MNDEALAEMTPEERVQLIKDHAHSLVMKWGVDGAIELATHEMSKCPGMYWRGVVADLERRNK